MYAMGRVPHLQSQVMQAACRLSTAAHPCQGALPSKHSCIEVQSVASGALQASLHAPLPRMRCDSFRVD